MVLAAGFWILVATFATGCAGPMLLGIKSYESGDTKINFLTGADFSFGINGVDTVNNQRGVQPNSNRGATRKVEAVQ